MTDSSDRILTTHVGSLPRPARLIELNHARSHNGDVDDTDYGPPSLRL